MSNRSVSVGSLEIGGNNPVRVESMLKTPLENLEGCANELHGLAQAGCEMVRVAFPDSSKAEALGILLSKAEIPLMADIHFDPDLAVLSLKAGVPAIRINPGNIGKPGTPGGDPSFGCRPPSRHPHRSQQRFTVWITVGRSRE